MKDWYIRIVKDVGNRWSYDNLNIKLKEAMKNELISYANNKKYLRHLKDVHNVIQLLKDPIMKNYLYHTILHI